MACTLLVVKPFHMMSFTVLGGGHKYGDCQRPTSAWRRFCRSDPFSMRLIFMPMFTLAMLVLRGQLGQRLLALLRVGAVRLDGGLEFRDLLLALLDLVGDAHDGRVGEGWREMGGDGSEQRRTRHRWDANVNRRRRAALNRRGSMQCERTR